MEAQLKVECRGRSGMASLKVRVHFGAESWRDRRCSLCLTLVPVQCAVCSGRGGEGVGEGGMGEGSRLLSCFSCSLGMQALVLLLWTGALLGHGSSQNVPSSPEVSRMGRWGSSSPSSSMVGSRDSSGSQPWVQGRLWPSLFQALVILAARQDYSPSPFRVWRSCHYTEEVGVGSCHTRTRQLGCRL